MTVAADTPAVTQGLTHRQPQSAADVLYGVMAIDMNISVTAHS